MTVQFFRITKDNYIERKYEQIAYIPYNQVKDFIKPSIGDTITVNGYRGEVTNVCILIITMMLLIFSEDLIKLIKL